MSIVVLNKKWFKMSKLNQIQSALMQIDQASFHKLCDSLLYKQGYKEIFSTGVTEGKNRTRAGTPDTFLILKSGKYCYTEYTVQQNDLFNKLDSNLEKCFNQEITKIPIDDIEKVILGFTSKLTPEEINLKQNVIIITVIWIY